MKESDRAPSGAGQPRDEAVEAVRARLEELADASDPVIAAALEKDDWQGYVALEVVKAAYAIDSVPAPVGDGEVEAVVRELEERCNRLKVELTMLRSYARTCDIEAADEAMERNYD